MEKQTPNAPKSIEIMDTTLRDGEQTQGVSFSSFEKLQLARFLLGKLQVDRIEMLALVSLKRNMKALLKS